MADFLFAAVADSGSPSAENGLSHEQSAERFGLPMGPSSSSSRVTPAANDAGEGLTFPCLTLYSRRGGPVPHPVLLR